MKLSLCLAVGMLVGSAGLRADFSYEQTSAVTGGVMKSAMKVVGIFSHKASRPMKTRMVVKGSRLARIEQDRIQITDLDAETITTIYPKKKRYQVVTFDQMRRYLQKMTAKRGNGNNAQHPEFKVKVSVNPTGKEKMIQGRDAREYDVKVRMESQDQKSNQSGGMVMDMHSWMAKPAAGYGEVREFYRRLGAKLHWMPGGTIMGMFTRGNKGSAEGINSVYKEAAKLNGMPVLQVISMGAPESETGQQPASGSAATKQEQEPQSLEGSIVRGLGGFGRFGRRHKKKKTEQQQSGPASSPGVLMEMTVTYSNFSNAPLNPSLVNTAPAGYKRVKSNVEKALR